MRSAVLVAVTLLVSGCGGGDGRRDALDAAERWLQAVAERDADEACALMAPSATDAIRNKYARVREEVRCPSVVRVYGDAFEPGDLSAIVEGGLEVEGRVKEGEVGVFPVSGDRELDVILMRRNGDEWKVASTTIDPLPSAGDPTPTPTPTATADAGRS